MGLATSSNSISYGPSRISVVSPCKKSPVKAVVMRAQHVVVKNYQELTNISSED